MFRSCDFVHNNQKTEGRRIRGMSSTDNKLVAKCPVFTKGHNSYGECLNGDSEEEKEFGPIVPPTTLAEQTVQQVCCGEHFTAILTSEGDIYTYGQGSHGQLGHSSGVLSRIEYKGNSRIIQIASGFYHLMLLDAAGAVWGCGDNCDGRVGLHNKADVHSVTLVDTIKDNIVLIRTGGTYTFFLSRSGKIYTCGWNSYGMLGLGHNTDVIGPQELKLTHFDSPVVDIQCGTCHTIFLTADQTAYVCGWNSYGQLGIGSNSDLSVPTKVPVIGITKIACSYYSSFLITNTGALYVAGQQTNVSLLRTQGSDSVFTKVSHQEIVGEFIEEIAGGGTSTVYICKSGKIIIAGEMIKNDSVQAIRHPDLQPVTRKQLKVAAGRDHICVYLCPSRSANQARFFSTLVGLSKEQKFSDLSILTTTQISS